MRFFVFFFDFSLVFIYISLIASWLLLFQGLIHDYIDQAFSPLKPLLTSKPEAHGYKQLCLTALRTDPSFQSELERKGEMKERPRGGGENHGPPGALRGCGGCRGGGGECRRVAGVHPSPLTCLLTLSIGTHTRKHTYRHPSSSMMGRGSCALRQGLAKALAFQRMRLRKRARPDL